MKMEDYADQEDDDYYDDDGPGYFYVEDGYEMAVRDRAKRFCEGANETRTTSPNASFPTRQTTNLTASGIATTTGKTLNTTRMVTQMTSK
jgi:hypothetical protein